MAKSIELGKFDMAAFYLVQVERQKAPEKYPWVQQFLYGNHVVTYLTDSEALRTVMHYQMHKDGNSYVTPSGTNPMTITKRSYDEPDVPRIY